MSSGATRAAPAGAGPPEVARGEPGATVRHPRANARTDRPGPEDDWPVHDLPVVIVEMLPSLLDRR